MARYKIQDGNQLQIVPVCLSDQLDPGTLEYAIHYLLEKRLDLSRFDGRYSNDETGRRAYDPRMLFKIVLFAPFMSFLGVSCDWGNTDSAQIATEEN